MIVPAHCERVVGGLRARGQFHKKSEPGEPLVTVITVVLNGAGYLEQSIGSVLTQTYENIEYIIIDGGSTDATLEIISKYEDKISYSVSEPDKGIYDAFNKGISCASGGWIYFLGADDFLYDANTIEEIFSEKHHEQALLYGDVFYESGRRFRSRLSWEINARNTIHHQSAFYRKELFNEFEYDTNLSVLSDYELNYRIYRQGLKHRYLSRVIAVQGISGASRKISNRRVYVEMYRVRKKLIGFVPNMFYIGVGFVLNAGGWLFRRFHGRETEGWRAELTQ